MAASAGTSVPASDEPRRRVFSNRLALVEDERLILPALLVVSLVLGIGVVLEPTIIPISFVFPLLVVAGLLLEPRRLVVLLGVAAVAVGLWVPNAGIAASRIAGVLVSVAVVMALVLVSSRSRARVGVRGLSGDRMFAELRDRIQRRAEQPAVTLRLGEADIDLAGHNARRGGETFRLLPKEAELLGHLLRHCGQTCSREELLRAVWGYDATPTTRTVDTHVFQLRQKLERDPAHPELLLTVHGIGYRLYE